MVLLSADQSSEFVLPSTQHDIIGFRWFIVGNQNSENKQKSLTTHFEDGRLLWFEILILNFPNLCSLTSEVALKLKKCFVLSWFVIEYRNHNLASTHISHLIEKFLISLSAVSEVEGFEGTGFSPQKWGFSWFNRIWTPVEHEQDQLNWNTPRAVNCRSAINSDRFSWFLFRLSSTSDFCWLVGPRRQSGRRPPSGSWYSSSPWECLPWECSL